MAPAPSTRISTGRPGRFPRLCPGSRRSAARVTVMWSAAVFDPALPGVLLLKGARLWRAAASTVAVAVTEPRPVGTPWANCPSSTATAGSAPQAAGPPSRP